MKPNQFLEHLIGWILLPQNATEASKLKSILVKEINFFQVDELANLLETEYKSYWKIHDELIELMVTNAGYSKKVKTVIKAFDIIVEDFLPDSLSPYWIINQIASSNNTTVLTLNVY